MCISGFRERTKVNQQISHFITFLSFTWENLFQFCKSFPKNIRKPISTKISINKHVIQLECIEIEKNKRVTSDKEVETRMIS